MCFVSVLRCFLCQTVHNVKRLPRTTEPKCAKSFRCEVEFNRCGYWYCDFNDKNVNLANFANRIGGTCGDQLCESNTCKLSVHQIDCCFGREQNVVVGVEIKTEVARREWPHSIDCYVDPCLTAPEVGRVLYSVLRSKDFRTLGAGRQLELENETYEFKVQGDVDQITLTVSVSRKSGEFCPQIYHGSFNRFLAFAFWKERKAASEFSLKDFFCVGKANLQ